MTGTSVEERRARLAREFAGRFGHGPSVWTRAPGRVELMGSHTDYNLGYVLTMSIDRETWVAARPRGDRVVRLASLDLPGESRFRLTESIRPDPEAPWSNYVRGVAAAMLAEGCPLQGWDGLVQSDIPIGSGLSSSAALEMAAGVAFQLVGDFRLEPKRLALLGQRAENEFVGVRTGILDQYSSALGEAGHALLLDCRELTSRLVTLPPDLRVVICDTRSGRSVAGSAYDERRAQCEAGVAVLQRHDAGINSLRDVSAAQLEAVAGEMPAVVARRCRFVVEENARASALAEALPGGDLNAVAALFAASFAGACALYEICTPEMGQMMAAMLSAPGCVAARQTGAGFGGCMISLVREGQSASFAEHVRERYMAEAGIGARVFAVQAAAGAGPLTAFPVVRDAP